MFPNPNVFSDTSPTEHFTAPPAFSNCAGVLAEAVVATARFEVRATYDNGIPGLPR